MELTDEELMLLEQLTYIDANVCRTAKTNSKRITEVESVGEMMSRFNDENISNLMQTGTIYAPDGSSTYMQGNEWAAVITEIKNNPKLMSLQIYDMTSFKEEGKSRKIDTMVFTDAANIDEAIVCYRGTLGAEEWKDNVKLLLTGDTKCNKKVYRYLENLPFNNITAVGHSKGGNKAAYVYYNSDKVNYCVAMDAPGFPYSFYTDHMEAIQAKGNNGNLKCYSLKSDFVNTLMFNIPGAEYFYCRGYGQMGLSRFAENHSPNSFFHFCIETDGYTYLYRGEDNLLHVELTEQSEVMKKLHGFTVFVSNVMPKKTKDRMSDYLGVVASIVMGNEEMIGGEPYNKDNLIEYLLSDMDTFGTLIAYVLAYMSVADIDIYSIFGKLDVIQEGFNYNRFNQDFYIAWFKLCNKYKISKKQAEELLQIVKTKYLKIMKNPKIKYGLREPQVSTGRKANYLNESHRCMGAGIKNIEDVLYEKLNKFEEYSGQEWYDILQVDDVIKGVNTYISAVTDVNVACHNMIEAVFNSQWELDKNYADKINATYESIDACINKIQDMSERVKA